MMPRWRDSFVLLYSLLRANLVASSSPTLPNLFELAAPDQDNSAARDTEIAPQSNGGEDSTTKSILAFEGPPTSLDTQFPQSLQSQSDVQPIPVVIDQPPPPTSNDQNSPLKLSGSMNVALDTGDAIPWFLPSTGGGSGEIQIGGPNILETIQQLFQNPPHEHKQPEPKCEERKIPFGGETPVKMFAMCCGEVPKTTGPGSCNRLRVKWRRNNCYVWPDERCAPGSLHCCHCKNRNRVGFECVPLPEDQGGPPDTTPNPKGLKRDTIPMTRRQDNIATNEPFSPVEIPGTLTPSPATAEEDNSGDIAMTLGETSVDKPKRGRGGSTPDERNCSPEFERAQGGTPPKRPEPAPSELDTMEPLEYEEHRKEDECPEDQSDLKEPENWSGNRYYWHDH